MASSCSTDHHCKFNSNIVLMFQDVNVTNSVLSALLSKISSPYTPPKFLKWFHSGKLREIRRPFFDLNNEKWNPLNSQRIARKLLNLPPLAINHAKFARFLLNSTNPCSPTVPQRCYSKSHEIRSIR